MSFDYGVEESEILTGGGKTFKNPEVGPHGARLRSLIHVGKYQERFGDELKTPANQVIAIFELKEEDDFEEDGSPLTIHKAFPLKKKEKAFMVKFIAALDPKGTSRGFDDLIGRACNIDIRGSKATNEDGTPKYVNFGGMSAMTAKMEKITDELVEGLGVGHVRLEDMSKEALLEMPGYVVTDYVTGENPRGGNNLAYEGSAMQALVEEIRKTNENFGKPFTKKKEDGSESPGQASKASVPPSTQKKVESDLDDDEEF